jgi:2,3-bisphosphoglycerate-dependent phosphoglycerate mutase
VAPQRAPLRRAAGLNKAETLEKYGEEQFMLWRRSYDTPPPPLDKDAEFSQWNDPATPTSPRTSVPRPSAWDVVARMLPYWESDIKPDLAAGKTVLVTAHGNSLRALVKHLDGISTPTSPG